MGVARNLRRTLYMERATVMFVYSRGCHELSQLGYPEFMLLVSPEHEDSRLERDVGPG